MTQRGKIIKAAIITTVGIIFFETFFYKIVVVLVSVIKHRAWIGQKTNRWVPRAAITLCAIGLWVTSPRIGYDNHDRIRMIYQDPEGRPTSMPIGHWIANTLVPEAEVANIALPLLRATGKIATQFGSRSTHLASSLINQLAREGSTWQLMHPYRNLQYSGLHLGSGFASQAFNTMGLGSTKSVYVISPKDYDPQKTYPVVVHMHGFLGNFQYYQGLLLGLDDYIVLSVATHDIRGEWTQRDLKDVTTKQLAFLERLGYKIDRKRVHAIGVSNGAYYGSTEAVTHFGDKFRSVSFVVGSNHSGAHHRGEMHIYGHGDAACPSHLAKYKEIKTTDSYFYGPRYGHFIIAYYPQEIREWLTKRWREMEKR